MVEDMISCTSFLFLFLDSLMSYRKSFNTSRLLRKLRVFCYVFNVLRHNKKLLELSCIHVNKNLVVTYANSILFFGTSLPLTSYLFVYLCVFSNLILSCPWNIWFDFYVFHCYILTLRDGSTTCVLGSVAPTSVNI
jgi:hypothetical protein